MAKTDIAKALAQRELARRRLLYFVQLTYSTYTAGWIHEDVCMRLEKFSADVVAKKAPRLMLLTPPRHGKALADDTLVYTKKGWKTHGTLEVGDEVLGIGGWTAVIGVSDPVEITHEVLTTTGQRISCHLDHEWLVDEYRSMSYEKKNPKTPVKSSKKFPNKRMYIPAVLETRDFVKWKEDHGGLFAISTGRMRRFYLPDIRRQDYGYVDHKLFVGQKLNAPNGGRRAIADVIELPFPKIGRCIQVAADDGVYLVTRGFVPTHNSELASIRFPSWHLGHNPSHEIINIGYNLDLPMKFSRKVREIAQSKQYIPIFPKMQMDPASQSAEAWLTTEGGGFTAAGVGGGITGKGAHILLIDDPIKNQEDADSPEVRRKLWDWYQSTAYTRLAPGGGVLVIQTRWNDDDLAGRLLAAGRTDPMADQFEVVSYPALSEAYEYRHRETREILRFPEEQDPDSIDADFLRPIDTCLHEERYPTERLKQIRANMQPRIWSALFQQNPTPDEGVYFRKEDFRYYITPPRTLGMKVVTAWDFAIGIKNQNDYTVGVTMLQDENNILYVLNVRRFKGDTMEIVEAMVDEAAHWMAEPDVDYKVGVEDGQIFMALKPVLDMRMHERRVFPPIEVLKPFTDKLARARPLQGQMQHGRVYWPDTKLFPWSAAAVHEMLRFPAGAHDDIVDAAAWAGRMCTMSAPPMQEQPAPLRSWRDELDQLEFSGSHMAA